ncbi:MAG: dihydroneopterin aldolase [Bacteroidaceae bacterium]|nr:dihydroneopterin aldolase [Bacteroidaceae bacterium]
MPQEQSVGGDFIVSVEVELPDPIAIESDNLDDTINYADIAKVVQTEMAIPSKLLEHAAGRIAKKILFLYPAITTITVRITKQNPPLGLACKGAGVEFTLLNT